MKQMYGYYYSNNHVSNPNPAWAFGFFASPENLYSYNIGSLQLPTHTP